MHPDFGSGHYDGEPIGIPITVVPGTQPPVPVSFTYADQSDPGPYPIPPDAKVEGGRTSTGIATCSSSTPAISTDYQLWAAYPKHGGTSWAAGSGAAFPLGFDALRPAGWTSA